MVGKVVDKVVKVVGTFSESCSSRACSSSYSATSLCAIDVQIDHGSALRQPQEVGNKTFIATPIGKSDNEQQIGNEKNWGFCTSRVHFSVDFSSGLHHPVDPEIKLKIFSWEISKTRCF